MDLDASLCHEAEKFVACVAGMDSWNRQAITGPDTLTGGGGSTGTLGRAGWPGS